MTETAANEQAWAVAADWSTAPRMNELEGLMWRSEHHPWQSSTLTSVMLLDCVPDWQRLVAAHEWSTTLISRSRQRVIEPALPVGLPTWVADENFDLEYHLQRAKLPFGTDLKDLLTFAESFALRPLDRTRPLWESVLVDNLDGGRAAYILKFHHSLTDGVGATQLLSSVQSRTREPTPDKPLPQRPAETDGPRDAWRLTIDEIADQLTGLPDATRNAVTMGVNTLIRPASAVGGALRYAASLRRVLTSVAASPSPLLSDRTGRKWRFAALDYSLERLRAAAKSAGGSVNDAFVASLLGGLRRYHELHNTFLDQIPMAMPVSMRKTDDPMGGNKFAGAFFAAPMGLADPVERISAIRAIVQSLRGESALDPVSLMAPVLNRTPAAVGGAAGRLVARADISASNFPGMAHETFIAGARVERIYPFGPLPGVAIMATMTSHAGVCCIGLNIDGSAVSDCDVLVRCFSAGFDEVLSISKPPPRP